MGVFTRNWCKFIFSTISAMILGYMAGPMIGELVRAAFCYSYATYYGVPTWWSLDYWLIYNPMRGHIQNLGYHHGASIVSAVSLPLLYHFSSTLGRWYRGGRQALSQMFQPQVLVPTPSNSPRAQRFANRLAQLVRPVTPPRSISAPNTPISWRRISQRLNGVELAATPVSAPNTPSSWRRIRQRFGVELTATPPQSAPAYLTAYPAIRQQWQETTQHLYQRISR
jgi:hypothetical protein